MSALLPALEKTQGVWLGWCGAERDPGLKLRVEPGDSFMRAQFDYPLTWRQRFYAGFCNRCLWPLLHGFIARALRRRRMGLLRRREPRVRDAC